MWVLCTESSCGRDLGVKWVSDFSECTRCLRLSPLSETLRWKSGHLFWSLIKKGILLIGGPLLGSLFFRKLPNSEATSPEPLEAHHQNGD